MFLGLSGPGIGMLTAAPVRERSRVDQFMITAGGGHRLGRGELTSAVA
jgi:hypothetical protein